MNPTQEQSYIKTLLSIIILLLLGLIYSVWYGIYEIRATRYWTNTVEVKPVNMNLEIYGNVDASAPEGKLYLIHDGRMVNVDDFETAMNQGG